MMFFAIIIAFLLGIFAGYSAPKSKKEKKPESDFVKVHVVHVGMKVWAKLDHDSDIFIEGKIKEVTHNGVAVLSLPDQKENYYVHASRLYLKRNSE